MRDCGRSSPAAAAAAATGAPVARSAGGVEAEAAEVVPGPGEGGLGLSIALMASTSEVGTPVPLSGAAGLLELYAPRRCAVTLLEFSAGRSAALASPKPPIGALRGGSAARVGFNALPEYVL